MYQSTSTFRHVFMYLCIHVSYISISVISYACAILDYYFCLSFALIHVTRRSTYQCFLFWPPLYHDESFIVLFLYLLPSMPWGVIFYSMLRIFSMSRRDSFIYSWYIISLYSFVYGLRPLYLVVSLLYYICLCPHTALLQRYPVGIFLNIWTYLCMTPLPFRVVNYLTAR